MRKITMLASVNILFSLTPHCLVFSLAPVTLGVLTSPWYRVFESN